MSVGVSVAGVSVVGVERLGVVRDARSVLGAVTLEVAALGRRRGGEIRC